VKHHLDNSGKGGVVNTLVGAGIGGAAFYAATFAAQKIAFLQSRWWATPLALLVLGHVMKRWSPATGQAVVGAAGALLAFSYYVQKNPPVVQGGAPAGSLYSGAGALQATPMNRMITARSAPGRVARGVYSEAGNLVT
jgi:hypothetical protein